MTDNNEMIFGIRAVIEAVDAGKEIDRILIKRDMQGELAGQLFNAIRGMDIPVTRVPLEKLDRITRKNHQGVIAFTTPVTYHKVDMLTPTLFEEGRNPLYVLLDGVTDVRNFGAIARTAECAGVDAIIIPSKGSVSVTADAVKTSAGALMSLPVCREDNIERTIKYLRDSGFKIVGATEKGNNDYTMVDYSGPCCIIMGAEDTGIPREHLALCSHWACIPIVGKIESLNVSVAAGILIYQAIRHRQ